MCPLERDLVYWLLFCVRSIIESPCAVQRARAVYLLVARSAEPAQLFFAEPDLNLQIIFQSKTSYKAVILRFDICPFQRMRLIKLELAWI